MSHIWPFETSNTVIHPCRNGERIQFAALGRPVIRGDLTTHSQVEGYLPDRMATTPGLEYATITTLTCVSALVTRSWSKAGQASQTVAKPGLTRNKVMLCVWWDWKGIIHYELLPPGKTIDSELYCEQLMRLKQKVERKRPELINRRGVVFHHDNSRRHTSLATQQKLR
ncbi:hypothetical protein K1T71_010009 [Dendrolimus kikuchii]|uniref:Uncharacterized protein n=1 Tax=Dendrolimus kikuchii TaxID=765133 RepID=A0ACC1CTB4_9NEOP|nr:hypothetical protein K1T71_010009 [Dendrolimus kikuchii]